MGVSYTIHDLPEEDRPRERLRKVGVDNLSIQELLALVIEKGTKDLNVMSVAQNLLSHFGNVAKIKEATLTELQEVDGIGGATACKLKAVFKLGEKSEVKSNRCGQKIESAEDVYNLLKNELKDKKKEHMKVISLNSRNKVISINDVSIGTLNSNLSHPREIFEKAIRNSANSVILAHNHPSGNSQPSSSDIKMNEEIKKAGKIVGIEVKDHLIIGKENYFSFSKKGYL